MGRFSGGLSDKKGPLRWPLPLSPSDGVRQEEFQSRCPGLPPGGLIPACRDQALSRRRVRSIMWPEATP